MSKAVLYSQNPEVREDLRRIAAAIDPAGALFRTRAFSGDAAVAWGSTWLEAARHPDQGGWELAKYSLVPDPATEGGTAERRATLHQNICFYDALCEAARFEVAAQEQGLSETDEAAKQDDEDYLVNFARAAGIPFDNAGMPLLAASGRILADGTYSREAREVARAAPLVRHETPAKPASAVSLFASAALEGAGGGGRALVPLTGQNSLEAQKVQMALLKQTANLAERIDNVIRWLEKARSYNFKWCTDSEALWAPFVPILGQVIFVWSLLDGTQLDYFPRGRFRRACAALEHDIAALPLQSAEPLGSFTADARLAFKLLWARSASRRCLDGKVNERYMNKCLASFARAAAGQGWDEARIAQMQTLILTDLNSEEFDNQIIGGLERKANDLKRWLNKLPDQSVSLLPNAGPGP